MTVDRDDRFEAGWQVGEHQDGTYRANALVHVTDPGADQTPNEVPVNYTCRHLFI